MLTINTSHLSENNIQCFIDRLSSQGQVENAIYHETKTFLMNLVDTYHHHTNLDEQISVVQGLLQNILVFSLSEKPLQYSFEDRDGNSYTLNKTGSKVSLVKQPPSTWHVTFSGLETIPGKTVSVYEFEAPMLQAGLKNFMLDVKPNSISDMFTLLSNNPGTILSLAYQIVEDQNQTFPANLVKLAKSYIWEKAHNASMPKLAPTFPVTAILKLRQPENHSSVLRDFLKDGSLPRTDEEKCQLAVEFARAAKIDINQIGHYLIPIFKDVQHANFISCFGVANQGSIDSFDCYNFINLSFFLKLHFKGNAFSVNLNAFSKYQAKQVINAVCNLINHNPHIESVHIEHLRTDISLRQLFLAVGQNKSLTTLSLIGCDIQHSSALIEAINKNTALTKVNLKQNYLTLECAIKLMGINHLTWLNLEKNSIYPVNLPQLCEALKRNSSLTYCNFAKPGMPLEFEAHLRKNAKNAEIAKQSAALCNQLHLLSYAEVTQALPTDILRLIFEIGVAGIRREVN